MRESDRTRLQHMIEASETVAEFMGGRTQADLNSDRMLLFAIVRAVEIIGEAATHVSEDVRAESPDIAWSAIKAMRNRLIHGYFEVDTEIVWTTATAEIPVLMKQLRKLLGTSQENPMGK